MNTNPMQRMQAYWDARAAGNFMCGGAGAGLVLFTSMHAMDSPVAAELLLLGLGHDDQGQKSERNENGRPWRAINVMLNVRQSWMSRESVAAAVLFLLGAGLAFGMNWRAWPTAAAALVFIYCQARIIMAARGIPAWRMRQTGVLIVVTALAEGVGLFCAVSAWIALPALAPIALAFLIAARVAAFEWWLQAVRAAAGAGALRWAARIAPHARVCGTALPLAALALAALFERAAPVLVFAAGTLVLVTGAAFKFILITRMGQQNGYAIPRMPVRGVPHVSPR